MLLTNNHLCHIYIKQFQNLTQLGFAKLVEGVEEELRQVQRGASVKCQLSQQTAKAHDLNVFSLEVSKIPCGTRPWEKGGLWEERRII